MALDFDEVLDLAPIPMGSRHAARAAVALRGKIDDAGGIEPARAAAVQAILAATAADPPSELRRLRLLYQHAYTVAELEGLVQHTFRELGLAEPEP